MSTHPLWLKRRVTLGLLLTMAVAMNVQAGWFGHTMKWEEEVRLHDGQVIVAKRFYNLGGKPTWESRERAALDMTVTFTLPGTNKKIIWRNDFRDSVPEPNSLNLIRLDIVKGVPYLATYPAGCIAYNKWGRPNPPQVLFKYENAQWQRITLTEFPAELIGTQANVVVGRPATSLLKPFYTVAEVDAENHNIRQPEYKTILREAVKGAGGGCEELIRYRGYWIMPNDPVGRRMVDIMVDRKTK